MKNLIAHRGLVNKINPENTYISILSALNSKKYVGVEFDVRLTKDNKLVLMHDKNIIRTTNGTGTVENMTLKELKKYQMTKNKTQTIPTLERILSIKTNKILLIELKINNNEKELANTLIEVLKNYPHKTIYVMSFNKKVLNILKEYKHHTPLGHITILKKDITSKYDFYCIREMHLTKKILSTNKKIFIWGLIKNPNDKYYTIVDE